MVGCLHVLKQFAMGVQDEENRGNIPHWNDYTGENDLDAEPNLRIPHQHSQQIKKRPRDVDYLKDVELMQDVVFFLF